MIKVEVRQLTGQHADRSLMYPGLSVLTWHRPAWGWILLSIEPAPPGVR